MNGAHMREVQTRILQHFDAGEFRRLLRTHLDVELDEVAAPGDFGDKVWEVIEWAERVGRTENLLDAVYAERPNLRDGQMQSAFQEGNGVQRTVGQLEQGMIQVNDHLRSLEAEIRFLRWWVTASVMMNGVLGAVLILHVWA